MKKIKLLWLISCILLVSCEDVDYRNSSYPISKDTSTIILNSKNDNIKIFEDKNNNDFIKISGISN